MRFESLVLLEVVAVRGLLTTLPPAVEAPGAAPAPATAASIGARWVAQFGSDVADFAHAVTPGRDGGGYVAGYTYGSLPGQVNSGNIDGFLAHFDRNGNLAWARQFGHDGAVFGYAVAVDRAGRILVGDGAIRTSRAPAPPPGLGGLPRCPDPAVGVDGRCRTRNHARKNAVADVRTEASARLPGSGS